MAKRAICAAFILALVDASCGINARAADVGPTKAVSADTHQVTVPHLCTDLYNFVTGNCQLTWHGITIYGTIDIGGGWQSHGAPRDPLAPPGGSYYLQKMNSSAMWGLAPNSLSQSSLGIKGTEPLGGDFSIIFDLEAGFDPLSFRLANGPHSVVRSAGVPLNRQTAQADSSRAGQWYNGLGYLGLSSPTYGTLTFFRQNSLTLDGIVAYDPLGGSYAFSPAGFNGTECGIGDTEVCRQSTSLKYRVDVGHFRAATFWQFGGYAQNNAARGMYEFQVGADIPRLADGVLAIDAIYSYVKDAVQLALGPGATNAAGTPIPPFLPQTTTATISDNRGFMLLARYTNGPLKLYAGYKRTRFTAPSDPQRAFTDIAGDYICAGCASFNNTTIQNAAYGAGGFGDRTLQFMWTGARYAVTGNLDVMAGYYHYIQNSYFGVPARGAARCSDTSHSQCAGTRDGISVAIDWRFAPKWDFYAGALYTQVNGGLANGYIQHNNIDPTVGIRFRF